MMISGAKPHYQMEMVFWGRVLGICFHFHPFWHRLHPFSLEDPSIESTESLWTDITNSPKPALEMHHVQKAWTDQLQQTIEV